MCFVYLSDVPERNIEDAKDDSDQYAAFRKSRWGSRGCTLQELISPRDVWPFNESWKVIGTKRKGTDSTSLVSDGNTYYYKSDSVYPGSRSLTSIISGISTIPDHKLCAAHSLKDLSVARKMSWASTRQTTRDEDVADVLSFGELSICRFCTEKELEYPFDCKKR